MKFAHMGDCHLGGWRQPELKELNAKCFQEAIDKCIKEKIEFLLIAGDLFDSAYPGIETLKSAFNEFRRLKEARIPVFLIAGSHDYSISGKSFLDVLSKAGFCQNVSRAKEKDGSIILQPTLYKDIAIYGYPGKKSEMEIEEIEKVKLDDTPGMYKILMLHTSLRDAVGSLPVKAVDEKKLPKVDYVALGHLHTRYNKENMVYCGPTFPNNINELEDLGCGSFYIVNNGRPERQEIKLREVLSLEVEIRNGLSATDEILKKLEKENLKNKIFILRIVGVLEQGKSSDIDFNKLEEFAKEKGAFVVLRNSNGLKLPGLDVKIDMEGEDLEEEIIRNFQKEKRGKFNGSIERLMKALEIEKLEDEKNAVFEERLIGEARRVLNV